MKSVIVYYSNSGKTKKLAEQIAESFGGKLAAIEPKVPYGPYLPAVQRAGAEKRKGIIAEYTAPEINLEGVDTIFVGFPIWYGQAPAFVLDYLKKQDFSGKTVIPFATSAGSSIHGAIPLLQEAMPGATIRCPMTQRVVFRIEYEKWVNNIKALA